MRFGRSVVGWPEGKEAEGLKSRVLALASDGGPDDRIFESHKPLTKAITDLKAGFAAGKERWRHSEELKAEEISAKLPNFVVLGAPRCATTWLYACLAAHPDIFVPDTKEQEFFGNFQYHLGTNWYKKQFTGHTGEKAIGDVSVGYFASAEAPAQMDGLLDGASLKLIVVLREPVSRALSYYRYRLLSGNAPRSFERSLKMPYFRRLYIETGHYYRYYENYLSHFSKDQILILLYEEIQQNPRAAIKKVFNFLEVQTDFVDAVFDSVPNHARSIRNLTLHYLLYHAGIASQARLPYLGARVHGLLNRINNKVNLSNKRYSRRIDETVHQKLKDEFRPSNIRLQELAGIDLSLWEPR